jgi:hypothetical protein
LARRANLGAAKSCSLVIIFMIRPPTVVQRIGLRQPIAAFSWLAVPNMVSDMGGIGSAVSFGNPGEYHR